MRKINYIFLICALNLFNNYGLYAVDNEDNSSIQKIEDQTGIITLEKALYLALTRNPELAEFSWEIRVKESRALQAGLLPNPELGVELDGFSGTGERAGFKTVESKFQISQLIELGNKRSKRVRAANLEKDLALFDYETKRLDVLAKTNKDFIEVLALQERLELTKELVNLAEKFFNVVNERVNSGKVSPVEKVRAKANLSMIRIESEKVRRNYEAARKRLAADWGGKEDKFEKVEGALYELREAPSFEELVDSIIQNPDLARWIVELEQRNAVIELEKANRIVDLNLNAGITHSRETNDKAFSLGVSVPLPIFNKNQGGISEAGHSLAKAKKEQETIDLEVRTALTETYQTLLSAFSEATALKNEVLPAAQHAFDAAQKGYEEGKFGYLDILDTQQTFFEAKRNYIDALSDYHKAVSDIERLVGKMPGIKNIN